MTKPFCGDRKCKKKVHYYSPEMASVFTHKVVTTKNGERWIKLPKPTYEVNDPTGPGMQGDWPIDYQNYKLVKKAKTNKTLGEFVQTGKQT